MPARVGKLKGFWQAGSLRFRVPGFFFAYWQP